MPRQASVLVADEIRAEANGKYFMVGVYNSDITIPVEPFYAWQLWFLFAVETDIDDPFRNLLLEVTLPGQATIPYNIPLDQVSRLQSSSQNRYSIFQPFVLHPATLMSGRIIARVIHERGELQVVTPGIFVVPRAVVS
jgi:hypothetical protein